jgi:cyclophilin family peptidyl-prolyl cis-trans isomerase
MIRKLLLLILGVSLSLELSAQDLAIYRDQVQTMYVAYYGRPGDEGGIDFWANELAESNGNLADIISAFGNSKEFQDRFGDLDNEELVNNIFLQLLGRDADTGGLEFYVGKLESGEFTLTAVALDVANGAQNSDIDVIANKLAVANALTEAYVAANVSYGENEIVYAKQLIDALDSTPESRQAALNGLDDTLALFPINATLRIRLVTNFGDIVIEMYSEESPITVENFIDYIDSDFYLQTWFHRIKPGFVIQGGGFLIEEENPLGRVQKQTNAPIVNESSNRLSNVRGSLAMARTPNPHSATSQFYINLVDNLFLDYDQDNSAQGYAVFAYVVSGMEVVDQIAGVPTYDDPRIDGQPVAEVKILSVSRVAQ